MSSRSDLYLLNRCGQPRLTSSTALGLDGDLVTKDNFPLPNLGPKLDAIRQDLHHGKGFGVIRGLDPRKYSVEDLTMIHLGIQVYIANRQGRQDSKGNMLGENLPRHSSTKAR